MLKMSNINMNFKSEIDSSIQKVLKNVSLTVEKGDCLGILGESGSGKSTLGRIMVGILRPTSGEYTFLDANPYKSKAEKRILQHNISVVFQDYNTSVNPRFTVEEIIAESVNVLAKRNKEKVDVKATVKEYLHAVGLSDDFLDRFPHQLSGGQLQRVCIARAIAVKPQVILLDEAISSLDAHTQVQIMELLRDLQAKYNLTYVFITHDLTAITYLCNKVAFLYQGEITEMIAVKDIAKTKNAYARKLIDVVIDI
ncbi:MAG: dipeptide/oligopeptide/nickel ABC transporter ATP-binding protein [Pseudomonadota bacterium]